MLSGLLTCGATQVSFGLTFFVQRISIFSVWIRQCRPRWVPHYLGAILVGFPLLVLFLESPASFLGARLDDRALVCAGSNVSSFCHLIEVFNSPKSKLR